MICDGKYIPYVYISFLQTERASTNVKIRNVFQFSFHTKTLGNWEFPQNMRMIDTSLLFGEAMRFVVRWNVISFMS